MHKHSLKVKEVFMFGNEMASPKRINLGTLEKSLQHRCMEEKMLGVVHTYAVCLSGPRKP